MPRLPNLLGALALVVSWATAQQIAFQDDVLDFQDSNAFAESIVSTLSASNQHTTLLHLLQRSKCIPLLAHIGNATLFAPTDQAWKDWAETHTPEDSGRYHGWLGTQGLSEWEESEQEVLERRYEISGDMRSEEELMDNQNWWLRQHLLYHMLNYTLSPDAFLASKNHNVSTQTTLLFPQAIEPEHPPIPPPGPPWLPRGGEGMLGGYGQRLRLATRGSGEGGDTGKVGVDFTGEGGAVVWDGSGWGNMTSLKKNETLFTGIRWARNGAVVGIEGVLEPPRSIDAILRTHPSLTYLSRLLNASSPLPPPLPDDLSATPHLTVFAPSDEAFHGAFDDVERRYLEGGYGSEGVGRIVGGGVVLSVGKKGVGWRDTWGKELTVESATGNDLLVQAPDDGLAVNGTTASTIDIFASNGVIHILPTLLLPENFTLLNSAEKILLSVNATRFVSLLRSANLSTKYVGEPGKNKDHEDAWTILAPTDEVIDMMEREGHGPVSRLDDGPFKDASPLASLLQYHILPGKLSPKAIKDGMLVGTEMRTSALKGERQRLEVGVSDRLNQLNWADLGAGDISFGGATVLGKPVEAGRSIIYLLSSLLSPPDDVLQTAVSDLQLSTFVAAVYAAELDRAVKKTPGVTYLMPRNRAFNSLGLVMKYLLLPEGKDELRKVVRYHAIDGIVYSADAHTKTNYKTLEGGEITLRPTNGTLYVSSPDHWVGRDSHDTLPSNGELRPANIVQKDMLTSTGVIHTIDSVVMPADVSITIGKLVRGSKQVTMVDLLHKAGLDWILQGRQPSSDEIAAAGLAGVVDNGSDENDNENSAALPSYTLLCPSDKAFSRINITRYMDDKDALLDLLKLHIVPAQSMSKLDTKVGPPRDGSPISLADDLVYSTLLTSKNKYGDVAFRATGDNSFIVGIRNSRSSMGNDYARIGQTGRATVRWREKAAVTRKHKNKDKHQEEPVTAPNSDLWRGGMTLGGGVLMIDSVLIPYEPSWFSRWGWLVITLVGVGLLVLGGLGTFGWWYWNKSRQEEGYEPLEGEEEE